MVCAEYLLSISVCILMRSIFIFVFLLKDFDLLLIKPFVLGKFLSQPCFVFLILWHCFSYKCPSVKIFLVHLLKSHQRSEYIKYWFLSLVDAERDRMTYFPRKNSLFSHFAPFVRRKNVLLISVFEIRQRWKCDKLKSFFFYSRLDERTKR